MSQIGRSDPRRARDLSIPDDYIDTWSIGPGRDTTHRPHPPPGDRFAFYEHRRRPSAVGHVAILEERSSLRALAHPLYYPGSSGDITGRSSRIAHGGNACTRTIDLNDRISLKLSRATIDLHLFQRRSKRRQSSLCSLIENLD